MTINAVSAIGDMGIFSLYRGIVALRSALDVLYKKVIRILPAREGTREWWEKENELAMDDYRQGKIKKYTSLKTFLGSF